MINYEVVKNDVLLLEDQQANGRTKENGLSVIK